MKKKHTLLLIPPDERVQNALVFIKGYNNAIPHYNERTHSHKYIIYILSFLICKVPQY